MKKRVLDEAQPVEMGSGKCIKYLGSNRPNIFNDDW